MPGVLFCCRPRAIVRPLFPSDPLVCLLWPRAFALACLVFPFAKACANNEQYVAGKWVKLSVCDEDNERASQQWSFKNTTGEIVSRGAQAQGLDLCLGWDGAASPDDDAPASAVVSAASVELVACDGTYVWDSRFFVDTDDAEPVHGERGRGAPFAIPA